jgi:hypothetical protein
MNEKNTKCLIKKYPKIFRDVNKSPQETCMCWGFECGDGWFKILDNLCAAIQERVDNPQAVLRNGAIVRTLKSMYSKTVWNWIVYPIGTFCLTRNNKEYEGRRWKFWNWVQHHLLSYPQYKEPPFDPYRQVIAHQVKEKFGGLRFYYGGNGDPYIDGLVRMAENVASYTCEQCGSTDKTVDRNSGGWIITLCKKCRAISKI